MLPMRMSEFQRAVHDEFGDAYGRSLMNDLVLGALRDRTAREALDAGVAPREVWLALCEAMYVPPQRRVGVGRIEPTKRSS